MQASYTTTFSLQAPSSFHLRRNADRKTPPGTAAGAIFPWWETQGTDSRAGAASGLAKTGQKQAVIA